MSDLSKMIFCKECRFAIHVKRDAFTGKERWHCGQEITAIGEFGDGIVLSDMYGGCEFGERREERVKCLADDRQRLMDVSEVQS